MSYEYVFFLGSHTTLSHIELTAAFRTHGIEATVDLEELAKVAVVTTRSPIESGLLRRLGGCDRFASLLARFDQLPTADQIVEALQPLPEKKWQLGLSLITSQNINGKKLVIEVKKATRAKGSKVAFVLPKHGKQLNAAQVIFNDLTAHGNAEVTLIETAAGWLMTRTVAVQDIAGYELRDTKRPGRDAQVGMLPPKVAQMMVNVALGAFDPQEKPRTILDPFCGMGTVLQEGWLLGQKMVGSDASDRMIEYAGRNLQWLYGHFKPARELQPELLVHDVQVPFPDSWQNSFDAIVTEPFLGKPLSSPLPYRAWQQRYKELQRLYLAFFRHSRHVLRDEGVIVALLPVVAVAGGQKPSPTPLPQSFLDEVAQLGYRMEQLAPDREAVVYGRPDALVKRELTLWRKH